MKRKVYKVVRPKGTEFVSAAVIQQDVQLTYRLGRITKTLPNSLGIFVFENIQDARAWTFIHPTEKAILECITFDIPRKASHVAPFKKVAESLVAFKGKKASWLRRLKWISKFKDLFRHEPIKGTRLVRTVLPIREISI